MKNLARILPVIAALALGPEAFAAEVTPGVTLDTELRLQAIDEDNASLGAAARNAATLGTEARFKMTARLNPSALFFWEGRGVAGVGHAGFQSSDTGALSGSQNFLEWKQSYFQFGDTDGQPFYIRAGRQRLRDGYGLWWNRDFDAVKAGYNTTTFEGAVAAGQNLSTYNTSLGSLKKNDSDIANFLAEGSWQYYFDHFLEARALYQDDHSGTAPIGATEDAQDRNDTDGRRFWGGVRAEGKARCCFNASTKTMYRFEFMGLIGSENVNTTTPNSPTTVLVTGRNGQRLRAFAFDGAIDIPLGGQENPPLLHLGYAYGSGDGNAADGTDNAFRQTGLNGNFSRIGALSQNTDNYGTVLRPALSNMHVYSAGVTKAVLAASDAGVLFRYYRLADPATAYGGSVGGALDGAHRDLGMGVDLLFNSDLMKTWDLAFMNAKKIGFRSSVGAYRTGGAYGARSGEYVYRALGEVRVGL